MKKEIIKEAATVEEAIVAAAAESGEIMDGVVSEINKGGVIRKRENTVIYIFVIKIERKVVTPDVVVILES